MCWERYIRGGIFGEVYSAFESWQVTRHSNLHVKLPTITSYVIIACLLSPYPAYASCAACFLPALPAPYV
jgi:hypothetical protein